MKGPALSLSDQQVTDLEAYQTSLAQGQAIQIGCGTRLDARRIAVVNAAIDRGATLFQSTALGTNGRSCSSDGCHPNGDNLIGVAANYPHYVAEAGQVWRLEQRINLCITSQMSGQALDLRSAPALDLHSFVKSLSTGYVIDIGVEAQEPLPAPPLPMPTAGLHQPEELYQQACTACHSTKRITERWRTEAELQGSVDRMRVVHGSPINDEQARVIGEYMYQAQQEGRMKPLALPIIGRAAAIGLVFLLHILFANFALGGPMIAVATEIIGLRRGEEKYDRFARAVAKVNVVAFSTGALLGVAAVALLVGLYPDFWTMMVNVYFWPLVVEIAAFLLEGIFLYLYVYTWDRIRDRRRHLALGVANVVFGSGTMLLINGVAASMLTPSDTLIASRLFERTVGSLYIQVPTWFPLSLHRWAGAVSFIGFLIAAVAAWQYRRSQTEEERALFDWAGSYALRIGLIPLILMPFIGWYYATAILNSNLEGLVSLMMGSVRWAFNLQIALVGLLFVLGNFYLAATLRHAEPGALTVRWAMIAWGVAAVVGLAFAGLLATVWTGFAADPRSLDNALIPALVAVVFAMAGMALYLNGRQGRWGTAGSILAWLILACAVLAAIPHNQGGITIPLGKMRPWRYTAITGLMGLTAVQVVLYLRARGRVRSEAARPSRQTLLLVGAPVATLVMLVMGYAREAGRSPYLMYRQMRVIEETAEAVLPSVTPIPFGYALAVFAMVGVLFAVLAWLAVWTAHGGEAAGRR